MIRKMTSMVAVMAVMAVAFAIGVMAEPRDTPMRSGELVAVGVASNTVIYAGSMVAVDAAGYAVPASDTAGLKVLGRAQSTIDNSGTAGAGALTLVVRRGVFSWVNGDTFTVADIGTLAFVEDYATVQKAASATHDIIAGLILDVDDDGVWVDTYSLPAAGNSTVVNLVASGTAAVTGNATFGGTAAVTGNTTVGGTLGVTGAATAASLTATGLVKGGTLGISTGVLSRVAGTLVWIEGGVTNVLDADVTTP
jgi:hypothetical protein